MYCITSELLSFSDTVNVLKSISFPMKKQQVNKQCDEEGNCQEIHIPTNHFKSQMIIIAKYILKQYHKSYIKYLQQI
jgi:hypothetical protein